LDKQNIHHTQLAYFCKYSY